MIALIQRVAEAAVTVGERTAGSAGRGLLVLVCAEKGDTEDKARRLAQKTLRYRVFSDENGKMNLSVRDIGGDLLVVSQFTLAADTNSGNRPSFTPAADPETGRRLYGLFAEECRLSGLSVQTGVFGAHMRVSLVNDGPVTFWLAN